MNPSLKTWNLVVESYGQQIPVMLLYVLESSGSSPGRQGFFMAVNANGQMEGSIGGGIMEHKFVEMAKEKLRAKSDELRDAVVRKQIHDKSAARDQSGMICSGAQTILLYTPNKEDIENIQALVGSVTKNKNGMLTLLPGALQFSPSAPEKNFHLEFRDEQNWKYQEKTGYKNRLSIIGGGHCALALSQLMSTMDFYISLYDDRKGLKTMEENQYAHEKHVLNNYSELKEVIGPGSDQYVVIMTFGYRSDDEALRVLLDKSFSYLGVLGSRSKIEKMFETYRSEGIPDEQLNRIHTPIGISIKSHTPEEIAVSIAAEIILVKNR